MYRSGITGVTMAITDAAGSNQDFRCIDDPVIPPGIICSFFFFFWQGTTAFNV